VFFFDSFDIPNPHPWFIRFKNGSLRPKAVSYRSSIRDEELKKFPGWESSSTPLQKALASIEFADPTQGGASLCPGLSPCAPLGQKTLLETARR
jgi:hypothetical protein